VKLPTQGLFICNDLLDIEHVRIGGTIAREFLPIGWSHLGWLPGRTSKHPPLTYRLASSWEPPFIHITTAHSLIALPWGRTRSNVTVQAAGISLVWQPSRKRCSKCACESTPARHIAYVVL